MKPVKAANAVKRALIVGCGYVGSALGLSLCEAGWRVWGLRRSAPCPPPITSLRCDLTDRAALRAALAAVEGPLDALVYTVAASGFGQGAYRVAYVDGLRATLEEMQEPPARLLLSSSTSVYGQSAGEWVDEGSVTEPAGFSGRIMLEAEALAAAKHPHATVVRFGGIYGPGRARLIERVGAGLSIASEPAPYRNRIHRDDCAGVLQHLLTLERPGACYVAVDDEPASMTDVQAWLCAELGREPATLKSDERVGGRRGTSKRCRNTLLRSSGYEFRYPTFRQGYAAML